MSPATADARFPRCDRTAAWKALRAAFDGGAKDFDMRTAFVGDATRFERFAVEAPGVFGDLSKHRCRTFEDLEDTNFDLIVSLSPEAQHRASEWQKKQNASQEYNPDAPPENQPR